MSVDVLSRQSLGLSTALRRSTGTAVVANVFGAPATDPGDTSPCYERGHTTGVRSRGPGYRVMVEKKRQQSAGRDAAIRERPTSGRRDAAFDANETRRSKICE